MSSPENNPQETYEADAEKRVMYRIVHNLLKLSADNDSIVCYCVIKIAGSF